jgi:hypothetical protein
MKPDDYDPRLALSYHDLEQEARRLSRTNRTLRRAIRRLAEEKGDGDRFALSNDAPPPKPWREAEPDNTRQKLLLSGMECLAGQQDLFAADSDD